MDLALNNLQKFICHKTKLTNNMKEKQYHTPKIRLQQHVFVDQKNSVGVLVV